jgi:hypothetical protein
MVDTGAPCGPPDTHSSDSRDQQGRRTMHGQFDLEAFHTDRYLRPMGLWRSAAIRAPAPTMLNDKLGKPIGGCGGS